MSSYESEFWNYAANLKENTHTKVRFERLKSHFSMGFLLQTWDIFSEHLFRETPQETAFEQEWFEKDAKDL